MKNISYIFFDLDHTLWDYETNARQTLKEIYDQFSLARYFSSFEAFINRFHYINHQLWDQYNNGVIDRDYLKYERFKIIMQGRMDENQLFCDEMSAYFTNHCPRKSQLMPGTEELLTQLENRFHLAIITNGFDDIQATKLEVSGIASYFPVVITSESSGHRKPSPAIFHHAQQTTGSLPENSLMI